MSWIVSIRTLQRLVVLLDEGEGGADAGVDTRVVGESAALAEGNDTDKSLGGIDKRAARVTLARVLATGGKTSADHVVGEVGVAVAAGGAGDNGHADLVERVGAGVGTGALGAPASNSDGGTGSRVGARGREADVANGAAGRDRGRELPDGNVIVRSSGVVAGVEDDGRDTDKSATGGAALYDMLITCVAVQERKTARLTTEPRRTRRLLTEPMTLLTEQ